MGDIVNLKRVRKDRDRRRREDEAAQNRVTFGRSKADKQAGKAQELIEARRLDGHRLDSSDGPEEAR